MTLDEQVVAALDTIEAPGGVFFMVPDGGADLPAISYFMADDTPTAHADDREYETTVEYAIDVWGETKGSIEPIAKQVTELMKALGFERLRSLDVPKDETGAMHKHMRFSISF